MKKIIIFTLLLISFATSSLVIEASSIKYINEMGVEFKTLK